MEIIDIDKGETREGFTSYYFKILSRANTYQCSIVINDKKVIRKNCDCMHTTFEISRKVKTGKVCRHITECINYLKKEDKL